MNVLRGVLTRSVNRRYPLGVLLLLTGLAAGYLLSGSTLFSREVEKEVGHAVSVDVDQCAALVLVQYKANGTAVPVIDQIWKLCAEKIRRSDSIARARIIDRVYADQFFVGRVILWMVVLITLSGVALAGIQLLAAFNLATIGKDQREGDGSHNEALGLSGGQIEFEAGKVSVKSSVTGLLILIVSFAFFYIYIVKVYTIQSSSDDAAKRILTLPKLDAVGAPS